MKKLYEETAVQDIAAAIREKNGTATKYKVAEMGDAVRRCLNTGVETEVYTFDQCRAEVDRYLKNVTYDPSDYAVSQIPEYVTTVKPACWRRHCDEVRRNADNRGRVHR